MDLASNDSLRNSNSNLHLVKYSFTWKNVDKRSGRWSSRNTFIHSSLDLINIEHLGFLMSPVSHEALMDNREISGNP
ncbi:MAG: hypothetical protein IPG21_17615 [Saprospiraceae bacterium]|nr:hypothetical protein [Candidatus Vicinibacter affinis]